MKQIAILLVTILLVQQYQCFLGVDVSQLFPTSSYECMKSSGYGFVIARGYYSYGAVDVHVVQTLNNARAAGMITDIYMFPCRGKNPVAQVDEMMSNIPGNLYGMVWIDVETNPSTGCSWADHDAASNCDFLIQIINRVRANGKNLGIYASAYMWTTILGGRYACPGAASVQLWYAHYDGNPSFSDFSSFGGWSAPNIKQWEGTSSLCGASVDKDYY